MNKTKKVLRSLAVVGVLAALGALGAFSAFTSQADNPGNNVTAGTVTLADNDSGTALYNMTNAKPGEASTPACIRVDYTGSLPADVKLYTPSTIGALGPKVNLKIEAGTQTTPSFPDCTGFSPETVLFDDPLSIFPTSYAGSTITDYPGAGSSWTNGDAVVYRVTATLSASAAEADEGTTTGAHTLRWEAQNQ